MPYTDSSRNQEALMQFQVNEIDFDFTDSQGTISEDEQNRFVYATVGQIWEADDEDDLVEKITDATGWCINSLDFQHISTHSF